MAGSIPITNTVTQGELPIATELQLTDTLLLYRATAPAEERDQEVSVDMVIQAAREGLAPIDSPSFSGTPEAPTPDPGTNNTQIATTEFVAAAVTEVSNSLTQVSNTLQAFGQVKLWKPTTAFFTERTVDDQITPPDILYHEGSLWVVISNFTSGDNFAEKVGGVLRLVRIKMDQDIDHLELTAGASAPLFLDQEIGSYIAIRDFEIPLQHTLPNDRLKPPAVLHRTLCNGNITEPNVVTIYKTKGVTGTMTAVGTISFNTVAVGAGMPGTLVFNDAEALVPSERLVFEKGDILVFKLTTKSVDLSWIRLNLLGDYVPFVSPHFDEYLGPGPFVTMALLEFNGANGSTTYTDTSGRHNPVGYGGSLSTAQFVSGGSSFYANQDGRVFVDGYNVDNPDFDFTGKDFSITTHIKPISIGNDYVWSKTSGGNIGLNLKLGTNGLGEPIVYLWPMVNGTGVSVPDLLTRPGFTKVEVRRESGIWSIWIDDALGVTGADDCGNIGWEAGSGYRGFLIGGAGNDNRYSGYIDNFTVGTR